MQLLGPNRVPSVEAGKNVRRIIIPSPFYGQGLQHVVVLVPQSSIPLQLDPVACVRTAEQIKSGAQERQTTSLHLYPPTKLEGGDRAVSDRGRRRRLRLRDQELESDDGVPPMVDDSDSGDDDDDGDGDVDDGSATDGPTEAEAAEKAAFDVMCTEFEEAAKGYLEAIGGSRAGTASYLKRIAAQRNNYS